MELRSLLELVPRVLDKDSVRVGSPTRTEVVVTASAIIASAAAAGYTAIVNGTALSALVGILVASAIAVIVRIRFPRAAVASAMTVDLTYIAATAVALTAAGEPLYASRFGPAPLATIVTVASLAYRARQYVTWTFAALAAVAVGGVTFAVTAPDYVGQAILFNNMILFAAVPGSVATSRAERKRALQREREDLEHRAATAERLRIARDLHDALAHNLTLVNAQASVAEYLLQTDPAAAARALRQIAEHSAEALAEVRSTVGLLRYGDDPVGTGRDSTMDFSPTPGVGLLGDLVRTHRGAGMRLDFTSSGAPGVVVPSMVGATVYRVVQEALTNAAKHAPGAIVTVTVEWDEQELSVDVSNPTVSERRPAPRGSGQGLLGMDERVQALAGRLAVVDKDGEFRITAVLPMDRSGKVGS